VPAHKLFWNEIRVVLWNGMEWITNEIDLMKWHNQMIAREADYHARHNRA